MGRSVKPRRSAAGASGPYGIAASGPALALAVALLAVFCFAVPAWPYTFLPHGPGSLKLPGPGALKYANPAWNRSPQRQFRSLDEALAAAGPNLATQRYMRDTFGLSQAGLHVEADSPSLLLASRNRIIGWLDASGLRYDLNESRPGDAGPPIGYAFGLGIIADAPAYFGLRDSLISLRSASIRVRVDEAPYAGDLDLDSLRWFLRSMRAAKAEDQAEFERYFLKTFFEYRQPLSSTSIRGISCDLTLRLPPSQTASQKTPGDAPRWLAPFRDRPIVIRIGNIELLAWLSFAIGTTGLALTLALIAFQIRKSRRKDRDRSPGS